MNFKNKPQPLFRSIGTSDLVLKPKLSQKTE